MGDKMNVKGWLQRGTELCEQGKYSEAEEAFRQATLLDPDEAKSWFGVGIARHAQEKYPEAALALRHGLQLDPDYPDLWRFLGVDCELQEKYPEAEEAFRQATRLDPDRSDAWFRLGLALWKQEKYLEAEEALLHSATLDPDDLQSWIWLGSAFLRQGKYPEAEEAFRRIIQLDPVNLAAWTEMGASCLYQEKYPEAEEAFRRVIHMDPGNLGAWNNLGAACLRQGKCPEAEEFLRKATRIDPNYPGSWQNLGSVYRLQEKYPEAEEAFRRVIRLDLANSAAWHGMGEVRLNQEKYPEAEGAFRKVTQLDPDNLEAWNNIGLACLHQEKYPEAEGAFRKVTQLDPDNLEAWIGLSAACLDQGKHIEAEKASRQATSFAPENYVSWCSLGLIYRQQGKYSEAEEAFRQVTQLEPDDMESWYYLGTSCLHQEKYPEAEEALSKATDLNPDYPQTWSDLGTACEYQGKYTEAEEAFRKATNLDSDFANAWYNLGAACLQRGRYPEAILFARRSRQVPGPSVGTTWRSWDVAARARQALGHAPGSVLAAYRHMARSIESFRQDHPDWLSRISAFQSPVAALRGAVGYAFSSGDYPLALRFTLQLKARVLGDMLANHPQDIIPRLDTDEQDRFEAIQQQFASLERQRHGWDLVPQISYQASGPLTRQVQSFHSPQQEREWRAQRHQAEVEEQQFWQQVVEDHPELAPQVQGTPHNSYRFSLKRLQKRLHPGEAILETLFIPGEGLLAFLITPQSLAAHRWDSDQPVGDDQIPTLAQALAQIFQSLALGESVRFPQLQQRLSQDLLSQWGNWFYSPFQDALRDIQRLYVAPHHLLAQLPWHALPFPDGQPREVALLPSASFLRPDRRRQLGASPTFTLGLVAADSVPLQPLPLQYLEIHRLRSLTPPRRRWELTAETSGQEPTLDNLAQRVGLTRCLVLSCHGYGPTPDWGMLSLGTHEHPQEVTGRQLVQQQWRLLADVVITSACLTGQVSLQHPEEWLGLPLALQTAWQPRVMALTLWEVGEIPAVIWSVKLVEGLLAGLPVGVAQQQARESVRTVTRSQVEALWLAPARGRLSKEQWQLLLRQWQTLSRNGPRPFADPVYWAAFVLLGDPTTTIARHSRSGPSAQTQ